MNVIESLVPALSADRENALAPLRSRVRAASAVLALARTTHGDTAERLARIDLVSLRPRLLPEFHNTVGSLKRAADALLGAFDICDIPVDVRAGFRAAVAATTDNAFTSAMQTLARDVGRYAGLVEHVDALVRQVDLALTALEGAGTIFSDAFQVAPREQFYSMFSTTQPTPTSGAA